MQARVKAGWITEADLAPSETDSRTELKLENLERPGPQMLACRRL